MPINTSVTAVAEPIAAPALERHDRPAELDGVQVISGQVRISLATLLAVFACTGCWGAESRGGERLGVHRAGRGEVSILFVSCPSEAVEQVTLNLTDDDFEEIQRVLWEIEADDGATSESSFTVGDVADGFREVAALEEPLAPGDHVQVVVASSEVGTIPLSFTVGDLRSNEVLVRGDNYRSRAEFGDQAAQGCPGS